MAKPVIFDSITGILEQIVQENLETIFAIENEMSTLVLAPLNPFIGSTLSRAKATQLLHECFEIAEQTFSDIARQYSLDPWMSLLRRFPPRGYRLLGWEFYITLGLVRYSAGDIDSTTGKQKRERKFEIGLAITLEQVFDAFRLDSLANLMARIAVANRWVGKGAQLRPTPEDPTCYVASRELVESVEMYESRRPQKSLLADEGFLVNVEKVKSEFPLILLTNSKELVYIHEPLQDLYLLSHYLPVFVDGQPVIKILRTYEEPILDIFGASVDSIAHVLYSVSYLTRETTLPPIHSISNTRIELKPHDRSIKYQHELEFLFGLCQRGFIRFERNQWVQSLSNVISPWAQDTKSSQLLIEEFLGAFVFTSEDSSNIDLSLLRPIPYTFKSTSGEVYFDITATIDFISWILERAKGWYATQHGDRFTLALKQLVETKTRAQVVGWKHMVHTGDEKAEADLLIHAGRVLFLIECKAFRKSREFFRGDYTAVRSRRNKIRESVKQLDRTVAIVRKALENGDLSIQHIERVEGMVCLPTQEFLKPINEYGMLTDTIPRVCTPEELLQVIGETM